MASLDGVLLDQRLLRSSFSSSTGEPWFSDAVIAQALTESLSTLNNDLQTPKCPNPVSVSGSEFKMKRSVSSGGIRKRKPRASNKSPTTFIAADAANFRQMVQEVTGAKLPRTSFARLPAVVKPEPHIYSCLPTLDTSAFLFDSQDLGLGGAAAAAAAWTGVDFDSFACFPTLESWKLI